MKKFYVMAIMLVFAVFAYGQTASLIDLEAENTRLAEKEKLLAEKEQELTARESRLNTLEKDLIMREGELSKIRDEILANMDTMDGDEEAELANLAKLYSSTKPKAAAAIFTNMPIEKAGMLMKRMNAMNAGRIMAEIGKLDPAYAAKLTTSMSGGANINIPVDQNIAGAGQ